MGNMDGREWQSRDYVLSYFGRGRGGRRNYLKFVEEGILLGRKPELGTSEGTLLKTFKISLDPFSISIKGIQKR